MELRGEHRVGGAIHPAAREMQRLLLERALVTHPHLLHDAQARSVVREGMSLHAPHTQIVEREAQQGSRKLGAIALPGLARIDRPAELGLGVPGFLPRAALTPRVLHRHLPNADNNAPGPHGEAVPVAR
ncbi:hypothetical protein ROTO_36700 [Roseovarius tolerans]|uniref:Uncharacterized protein n=1 Tax=Roseovarius tolerans TaxID=74031 RepID=A0A0L6CQG5_9RHOB|nr:hypothetical protein ROTO_36700 [Roseovarius tolerans]